MGSCITHQRISSPLLHCRAQNTALGPTASSQFPNPCQDRPLLQAKCHEAFRSTEIFWRANKDTRYLLDCVLVNLTGRPFIASVHQIAPAARPIGAYENPENLAVIVPAVPRSGDVQLSLFLSKVGRDANPAFIAVELKGCEIQPLD